MAFQHHLISSKIDSDFLFDAQPHPQLILDDNHHIIAANLAAEFYFQMSRHMMKDTALTSLIQPDSPLYTSLKHVNAEQEHISKKQFDLRRVKQAQSEIVDIHISYIHGSKDMVLLLIQPQTIFEKINHDLNKRGATRSMMGMVNILAHEVKNPLFGIHGAAQLLETTIRDEDKPLLHLIKNEVERIKTLVERMDVFNMQEAIRFERVNIHTVLDRVVQSARNGFARKITIKENYDPSLPEVMGNPSLTG